MRHKFVMAQTMSGDVPADNLRKAEELIGRARAEYRADMVLFPEYFMYYYKARTPVEEIQASAQPLDGPFVTQMRRLARENRVWVLFGMNEAPDNGDKRIYNTMVLLDAGGEIVVTYRKSHLYDADAFRESDIYQPSDRLFTPIDTPFGRLGLMVCYELRFPEVARHQALHGAQVLLSPAAWVRADLKPMHWKVQLACRAIENGIYVVAPNHYSPKVFLGESIAVDPTGVIIANGTEEEDLVPCAIDLGRVEVARKKFPNLINRRPELYR